MKRLLSAALALGLCASASAQEHKPTRNEKEVLALLQEKAKASKIKLLLVDQLKLGALKAEGFDRIFVEIDPKKPYAVLGACDGACTNLDIIVWDAKENVVDSDLQPDASPVIFMPASSSATAKIKLFVSMKGCSDEPCTYGVGLYQAQMR